MALRELFSTGIIAALCVILIYRLWTRRNGSSGGQGAGRRELFSTDDQNGD